MDIENLSEAQIEGTISRLGEMRQQRIAEKIAKGEAVLRPYGADAIIIGVERPEAEKIKWPKRDADGREIYYLEVRRDANESEVYDAEPLTIVSGVPDAEDDE
jgi:hypothetical protein